MRISFFVAMLFLLISCESKREEQPISKAEATAFAKQLEASVEKSEYGFFEGVLDMDAFADEVAKLANRKSDKKLKEGIKLGLQKQNLSRQILQSLGADGFYHFIKQYEKDGAHHIVFRLYGDGGLNYHDFTLVKFDNKIKVKDIYMYLSGENLSKTAAQMINILVQSENGNQSMVEVQARKLIDIKQLITKKKFKEAKEEFDELPETVKKERAFQMINIQITQNLDQDTYTKSLEEFERGFGNEPSAQLMLLDAYILRQEFDKSLKVINEMDATLNDPLLDYYRYLLHTQKGNADTALNYLEKLNQNMPNFETANIELMATYIDMGEFDKANAILANFKKNKKFNQSRLDDIKLAYPLAADKMNWDY